MPQTGNGEVWLEVENRRHQRPRKASLKRTGSKSSRIPSHTVLKIAWGSYESYCVARNRG